MLINVPQYIDVEDKVAGPLTLKQLGWLIAMGIILLILWNIVPAPVFFVLGIPIALMFIAFAFYKPYGQPLGNFILFGIVYFFRPKIYVWKRTSQNVINVPQKSQAAQKVITEKHLTQDSLKDLAQLLDSEGTQHSDKVEEILKQMPTKKA